MDRYWATAARIAWREGLASRGKFLFVVLAVAAGVGALTGVRGFARAFRTMLLEDARTLMAADFTVRMFRPPGKTEGDAIAALERRGVRHTTITETISMMSATQGRAPVLVFVKAVDPARYPFYGRVETEPAGTLAATLTPENLIASDDLLLRLNLKTGDTVKLGSAGFRLAAVTRYEPDRMTGSLNVGPRVMISREGLDRSGLIIQGSRASQRFLFALPPNGLAAGEVRAELQAGFPEAMISDFRQTHPMITRGLNRSERFLSLVSLIALVVGAIGVAMAMHAHLEQRMESIAMMKCLGARAAQVLRVYVVQTLGIGLIGGAAGLAVGAAIQTVFPVLIARFFPLPPRSYWSWEVAAEGLAVGLLVAVLFTLPPLLAIRRVRPAAIFRRNVSQETAGWRERVRRWLAPAVAGVVIIAGIGVVAVYLAGGPDEHALRAGGYFSGGLAAGLLILSAIAWAMLRVLRFFIGRRSRRLPSLVRHGLANVYRPGNQAPATMVALGAGVMFTLTVYLVQHGLVENFVANAPKGMPNVILFNITGRESAGVAALLEKDPARESAVEMTPMVNARVVSVNGATIEGHPDRRVRRYAGVRGVTWRLGKPWQAQMLGGDWWTDPPSEPRVCIEEDVSRDLSIRTGARIEFLASGRTLKADVACVWRRQEFRLGDSDFVFSPGSLDGLPSMYIGGARLKRAGVGEFQRVVFEQFPTVTVVNVAEILEIAQGVIDQVALVVRFVAAFAILAGAIILGASVAGTRMRRIREVAVLKTLGATRGRVVALFSVEFLIIGAVAGLMGGLLAGGFTGVLMPRLLEAPFRFGLMPVVTAMAACAVIANIAGWLASWRILALKPLEILRQE